MDVAVDVDVDVDGVDGFDGIGGDVVVGDYDGYNDGRHGCYSRSYNIDPGVFVGHDQ